MMIEEEQGGGRGGADGRGGGKIAVRVERRWKKEGIYKEEEEKSIRALIRSRELRRKIRR